MDNTDSGGGRRPAPGETATGVAQDSIPPVGPGRGGVRLRPEGAGQPEQRDSEPPVIANPSHDAEATRFGVLPEELGLPRGGGDQKTVIGVSDATTLPPV